MAIIQISKIQQRSGNLVDLPQLDEAEFGWASDAKRLFIGKTTPNENIEVLTSYSTIAFSQIDGAVGNLNVNTVTLDDGQVLAYDGTSWTNKGGNAGGLLTLGNISNVKIDGGATGFVLQTDGTGNLSWAPTGVLLSYIQDVTKASPAVVTTVEDNYFTDGAQITFTNAQGMTDLNGESYYADVLTANSFALYSDAGLATPVDSSSFNAYAYTSVTATTITTNYITVGNTAAFTVGQPVQFLGDLANSGISNTTTYYVANIANTTAMKVSTTTDTANTVLSLQTTSGLTANVYQQGGRAVGVFGAGSGTGAANGTTTMVQFNTGGVLDGVSDFTFDKTSTPKLLTVNGNANIGNLNATGVVTSSRLISNVTTGTAPLQVVSTTVVPNLYVARANVADFSVVTSQSTGTYYPVFVNGSSTANYALAANSGISANLANGSIIATTVVGNLTGNVTGNVNGNISGTISAPGANTQVIFNDAGNINAVSGLTFNKSTNALTATGNVTGGNLVTGGVVAATGNVTGGNLTTAGALSVTGNANVGNIGAAAGVFSANVTGANVRANSYFYRSVATAQTATGTVQGNAATFTTEIVEFSTVASGTGAILPSAAAGLVITIVNTSANTLNVYPASGDTINSLSVNVAYTHVAGATLQYVALDATRWYTVGATFA